jgi:hypothetical protein
LNHAVYTLDIYRRVEPLLDWVGAVPEEKQKPTLKELAQRVSKLLGGELTPEEIERTIRQLREAESRVKWYMDWV